MNRNTLLPPYATMSVSVVCQVVSHCGRQVLPHSSTVVVDKHQIDNAKKLEGIIRLGKLFGGRQWQTHRDLANGPAIVPWDDGQESTPGERPVCTDERDRTPVQPNFVSFLEDSKLFAVQMRRWTLSMTSCVTRCPQIQHAINPLSDRGFGVFELFL